jgi:hypothetical protein
MTGTRENCSKPVRKDGQMKTRAILKAVGPFALLGLLIGCATLPPAPKAKLRLQTGRYGHAAVTDGRRLYVIGGSGPESLLGDIEAIDPQSGKAEVIATNLIPRRYHSALIAGDRIYVVGGESEEGAEPAVEIFDLKTRTVSQAAPLPTPRRLSKAVLLGGDIYVIGGQDQDQLDKCAEGRTGKVEAYDIARNRWRDVPSMPTPRECAVVAVRGKICAIGGFNGDERALPTLETYDPKADAWTSEPDMPFAMSAHSALLAKDHIFTFGDYRNLDQVARCSLRDGKWTEVDVAYAKSRHNACVALGGEVFVVGGNIAPSGSHLDVIQRFSVRDLLVAKPRLRTGTETRGFLEPSEFAGMLEANEKTLKAKDRSAAAVQTVALQLAGQEIVRNSSAAFRLRLDKPPILVRLTAEVWHQGAGNAPRIVVNGKAAGEMQFNWPGLRERNYVTFLWEDGEKFGYAVDYQGWLQGTAFIAGKLLKPGDNAIAIKVGTDQIKVRNVKAEVLSAFDDSDTLYDLRGESRSQPIPMLPAEK